MPTAGNSARSAAAKLAAVALVAACIVLGVLGIVLPVLPGLVFLALALVVAAKAFPTAERVLRRNATLAGYLDTGDRLIALPLGAKVRAGAWLALRGLLTVVATLGALVRSLLAASRRG